MMEELRIAIVSKEKEPLGTCTVRLVGSRFYDCRLTLSYEGREYRAEEGDYFECLRAIRRELEPLGLYPLSNGAALDCFPSAMARQSGGLMVYRHREGRRCGSGDLVRLFDSEGDIVLATVEEQSRFLDRWRDSLPQYSGTPGRREEDR